MVELLALPQRFTAQSNTMPELQTLLLFIAAGCLLNLTPCRDRAWIARRDAVQRGMHWLDRAAGVMFIAFGLKLAFADNPAS